MFIGQCMFAVCDAINNEDNSPSSSSKSCFDGVFVTPGKALAAPDYSKVCNYSNDPFV
jgi:hypothetical protein